jgi:hypothetical protein
MNLLPPRKGPHSFIQKDAAHHIVPASRTLSMVRHRLLLDSNAQGHRWKQQIPRLTRAAAVVARLELRPFLRPHDPTVLLTTKAFPPPPFCRHHGGGGVVTIDRREQVCRKHTRRFVARRTLVLCRSDKTGRNGAHSPKCTQEDDRS